MSQVPFSSVNIGIPDSDDAALVCKCFLLEYNKGMGKGEQQIFPNIIFRVKKGINANPEDPYYYLLELAVQVAAKRMNPTFRLLDNPMDLEYWKKGIVSATMGCRTNVLANINGPEGPGGRGNIAPISINLVRIAIEAGGNWTKFYKGLDKIMDLCDEELMYRYSVLKKLKIKDMPFVAGQGLIVGSEGLSSNDSIEPILLNGTWGIGFIGLAEALVAMMGCHHGESEEARKIASDIVNHMSDKVQFYKEKRHLNYTLYATPAEGLSGRFTAIDKKKYGEIKGVTDKKYYTNSFHIPVEYNIGAVEKANIEAPFHQLCTAGMISYFEIDGGSVDEKAAYIMKHLQYCINNTDMVYLAYNFRVRYCKACGQDEIKSTEDDCPRCESDDLQGISRVTGYMAQEERFGEGKVAEREARVTHKQE